MRRFLIIATLLVSACATAPQPPQPQPTPVRPSPQPSTGLLGLTSAELV